MPQTFVAVSTTADPIKLLNPRVVGGANVTVLANLALTWQDGTTETIVPSTPVTTVAGASTVDGTATIWHLTAVEGQARLWFTREQDYATLDTVLTPIVATPKWAVLYRFVGGRLDPWMQP